MATPSLAMIPSGYKASKVYSVLPESGVGDFDFTRATTATRVNSSGLIETVATNVPRLEYPLINGVVNGCPSLLLEPQSTNLITYSSDFPRNYWTKSGATIQGDSSTLGSELVTNGSFTGSASGWALGSGWAYSSNAINATSTSSVCYQDIAAMQSNITYTVTYQISNYSGGNIQWRFGGTGTVDGATRNANGTYTESFTNSSSGDKRLFLSPSGFTGTIDNVSVKETQGFTSPDGTNNAYKVVEGTNNGSHTVRRLTGISVTASQDYTFSFFAKKDERSIVGISNTIGGADKNAFIDIENGIILSSAFNDSSIDNYGNGWYKISLTHTATNTADYDVRIYTSIEDGNFSYQGDGTSGIYVFGVQVEQGSFATSLINTSGSAVTRNAETCTGAGNAATFNDSEGVLFADILIAENISANANISISKGINGQNLFKIIYLQSDGELRAELRGSTSLTTVDYNFNLGEFNKVLLSYNSTKLKMYINGFEVGSANVNGLPSGLNQLNFDRADGDAPFYGKTKQLQYFQTTLTDSELEELTSWESFKDMADGQLYTII